MLVRIVRHRWSQALAAGPLLMLFALAPSVMSLVAGIDEIINGR